MISRGVSKTLSSKLRELPQVDFNIAVKVVVLAAVLNTCRTIWDLYDFYQRAHKVRTQNLEVFIDPSFILMELRIASALIISAVCLRSRKFSGLCFSLAALLWCMFEYLNWYLWSLRLLENLSDKRFSEATSHALNMYGATGWDAALLIIIGALFIWELKTLIALFFSFPHSEPILFGGIAGSDGTNCEHTKTYLHSVAGALRAKINQSS